MPLTFDEPAIEYPLYDPSSSNYDRPESFEPTYEQPSYEQPAYEQTGYDTFSNGSMHEELLDEPAVSEPQVSQLSRLRLGKNGDLDQVDATSEEFSNSPIDERLSDQLSSDELSSDEHSLSRMLIESLGQETETESQPEEFMYGGSELNDAEPNLSDSSPFGNYANRLQPSEQESTNTMKRVATTTRKIRTSELLRSTGIDPLPNEL